MQWIIEYTKQESYLLFKIQLTSLFFWQCHINSNYFLNHFLMYYKLPRRPLVSLFGGVGGLGSPLGRNPTTFSVNIKIN